MKFKQFLAEDNKIDAIVKQIVDKTPSNYVDAFLNEIITEEYHSWKTRFIFRGTRLNEGDAEFEVRKHPVGRVSANTSNEFTLMVDGVLSSWNNFPKRSESFICSTSQFQAEAFGDLHLLFPLGDANVGICSENDMWSSMNRLAKLISMNEGTIPDFNDVFNRVYGEAAKFLNDKVKSIKTPKDVKDVILLIQSIIDDGKVNELTKLVYENTIEGDHDLVNALLKHSKNFEDNLNWVLDPIENDLELKQVSDFPKLSKSYSDREVWFSADAAFLSIATLKNEELIDIQNRMKKLKGGK